MSKLTSIAAGTVLAKPCLSDISSHSALVVGRNVLVDGIPIGTWFASNKEKSQTIGDCRSEDKCLIHIISYLEKYVVVKYHATRCHIK